MRNYGKFILPGVLAIFCFYFLHASFQNLAGLQQLYPGWSARYDTAITDRQLQQLKQYCAEQAEETGGVWPGFWAQSSETVTTDRAEQKTDLLIYDGDPAKLFPVQLHTGGYPGELDETRCAVSTALSWALWGSLDTVGQTLTVGGKTYTVSGVFQQTDFQLIQKGNEDTLWTAMDLSSQTSLTREDVMQFLSGTGFPPEKNLVDGGGIYGIVKLAIYLPLVIAGILALCIFFLPGQKTPYRPVKIWLFWGFLLLLGCALPFLLNLVPAWLIPTKWSDFSFWNALGEKMQTYFTQWLQLVPTARDVQVKRLLYAQAFYTAAASALVPVLYFQLKLLPRLQTCSAPALSAKDDDAP